MGFFIKNNFKMNEDECFYIYICILGIVYSFWYNYDNMVVVMFFVFYYFFFDIKKI